MSYKYRCVVIGMCCSSST